MLNVQLFYIFWLFRFSFFLKLTFTADKILWKADNSSEQNIFLIYILDI